jgi:hypothetical protein
MDRRWPVDAVERADEAVNAASSTLELRRAKAWKLRVDGYSVQDIAAELNVSHGTAHADVRWCLDNLPAAYESAEDFRRVALPRLDDQYRRLTAGRTVIIEGEPVVESPTETAMRVAQSALDLQAKLLGAYAPSKVDGSVVVKYELAGVDTDDI